LAALAPYEILDTPAEEEYDALSSLAAYIAGTPIAFISLIDEQRQWYKSKIGFAVEQMPLEEVFCRYTVGSTHLLEVENTTLDERFYQDILVTKANLHYYCGVPLLTLEGLPIGTLCVSDLKPRVLAEQQKKALQTLAGEVMARMELRRQNKVIERQKELLLVYNEQLEQKVAQRTEALQVSNVELSATKHQLDTFLYRASHDLRGPLSSLQGLITLAESDIVSGIMKQAHYLGLMDKCTGKLERVLCNLLAYSQNLNTPLASELIDMEKLLNEVEESCQKLKGYERVSISFDLPSPFPFYSDRYRLGCILKNVLENSIVFQNHNLSSSTINLKVRYKENMMSIRIEDNGIGIPSDKIESAFLMFSKCSTQSTGSGLGLFVAKALTETLQGSIHLSSIESEGTVVEINIANLEFYQQKS
jgi:signal transduction histidine kinase